MCVVVVNLDEAITSTSVTLLATRATHWEELCQCPPGKKKKTILFCLSTCAHAHLSELQPTGTALS